MHRHHIPYEFQRDVSLSVDHREKADKSQILRESKHFPHLPQRILILPWRYRFLSVIFHLRPHTIFHLD